MPMGGKASDVGEAMSEIRKSKIGPVIARLSLEACVVGSGWTVDLVLERQRLWGAPPNIKVKRKSFTVFSYDYQNRHLAKGLASGLKDVLNGGKVKRRKL